MSFPDGKYAWTVKVGERGQFVIPKAAREIFHIHPGDTIIVLGDEKEGIAIPLQNEFAKLTLSLFGSNSQSHDDET